MSTSSISKHYQNIAIAGGTGELGHYLVEEFLKDKDLKVTILTRASSENDTKKELKDSFIKQGGQIVEVNYNNQDSVLKALIDIDVVIVTLSLPDLVKASVTLIDASVKANVKLFIPSEFGAKVEGVDNPFTLPKKEVRSHLESSGLDYIYYNNGFLMEHLLSELFGIDVPNHKAKIVGSGETKLTITSVKDVAKCVVNTYFLPGVKNKFVNIVGENACLNEVLKNISEISNKPFEVEKITLEEAEDVINAKDTELMTQISYLFKRDIEKGYCYLAGNFNHFFPGFKFVSIKDFSLLLLFL
ncbi:NAD(P)-binding protein [Neoconidiobolus thromboides FSU 785]|nr:NAD(P)-binding protein [Neoconidiobolus thromboides FSU 785]